jgi:DinB superfamily
MITDAERTFAVKQLDQSRGRLLRLLQGLSAEQLLYRPEPGRWSIAENVEHLVVVEKRLVGAIEKLLPEPPDVSKQCSMADAEVVWLIGNVVNPVQAPERVLPSSRWPAQSLVQEFETARQNTRDFASATAGDFRRHFINHFLFGDLDCYQWLLLIGAHCNRHCAQSEAVKLSRAFPV